MTRKCDIAAVYTWQRTVIVACRDMHLPLAADYVAAENFIERKYSRNNPLINGYFVTNNN